MDVESYPIHVQLLIREFVRRGIFDKDTVDQIFINYLLGQKFDEDYIRVMKKDRYKE